MKVETSRSHRWLPNWILFAALLAAGTLVSPSIHAQTLLFVPADTSSLQQAIASVPDGGIIELAAGTYSAPQGGFTINDQPKSFTIRAAAGAQVFLDGGGARDIVRLINSSPASGRPVTFQGITFSNGFSTTAGIGGGVTLQNAEATFRNCVFQNNVMNSNQTGGGGLSLAASTAFFFDCAWNSNSARTFGGGLAVETQSRVFIHRGTFSGNRTNLPNHVSVSAGGAIHVANSLLRVSNSRFDSNQAGYVGGAIYALGSWADPVTTQAASVLVTNCTFINNRAARDASVSFSAPTEGGAFHAEDQTTAKIYNSRFITNQAMTGGAISLYRAIVEVRGCVLQGNQATGTGAANGFGGGVSAVSNDAPDATTGFGTINRRVASLVISDTLIQGRFGSVTTVAQTGGGLYVTGDSNSLYGQNGMPQSGTAASNQAIAQLTNVLLIDCDVQDTGFPGTGVGGGLEADLTALTVSSSLFADCDAVGTNNASGGGLAVINQSSANVSGSTLAHCTAGVYGGGVFAQGSTLNMNGCNFIGNEVSPGFSESVSASFGAALFTAPADPTGTKAAGIISNCVFTENAGLPIFDDDRAAGPINDVRYNGNQIYSTAFGATVYTDSVGGFCCRTVAQLNGLTVTRNAGIPSTVKAQSANVSLGSRPTLGVLRAAPASLLAAGASGDAGAPGSFLAYAWSGNAATLDGTGLGPKAGATATMSPGTHTLIVDGSSTSVSLQIAPSPAATLGASPLAVPSGSTTTLSWTSSSGTFLDVAIDHGIAASTTVSGSVGATLSATTVFSLYELFEEGGMSSSVSVAATGAAPAILSFSASPVLVDPGGFALLSWSTANGTSTLLSGGPASPSANMGVTPTITTAYPLSVFNAFGRASRTATVNVNAGVSGLAAPPVTNPISGGTYNTAGVTFSWNSVGGAAGYDLRLLNAQSGSTLFSGSLAGGGSTSTLIGLSNGSYVFAIRACGSGGFSDSTCGRFATRSFLVALTAPNGNSSVTFPAPGAVLAGSTQTFTWTSVSKSDPNQPLYYEVLLRDVTAGTTELQITVPDPQLSTVYSMHSSTQYELKVRACQAGCGPYSTSVVFSVALPAVPTAAPAITGTSVSGGNSLSVTWTGVARADSYQVQVIQPTGGPGGGALTVAARQVSGTSVTLGVPSGFANVIVAGCNGDGCGPSSAPVGVTPSGPNPSAPVVGTPIAGTVVTGPGVTFSWSRVPGDTGSNTIYRLYVQDLSRQAAALDVYTTQNFWAAALKAEGSRYDVQVVANPGPSQVIGPSSGFNLRGVSAAAPTMVAPGHQSSVAQGNVLVSWSPVPNATLYEYFVAVQGQTVATATGVTQGLFVQVPLRAVAGAPPIPYSAIARACPAGHTCSISSDAGWGPWSNAPGGPGVTNFSVSP